MYLGSIPSAPGSKPADCISTSNACAASRGKTAASASPTVPGDLMDTMTFTTGVQETFAESRAAARRVQLSRCATRSRRASAQKASIPRSFRARQDIRIRCRRWTRTFTFSRISGGRRRREFGRPIADGLQYGRGMARPDCSAAPYVFPANRSKMESRRADSNRFSAHYESATRHLGATERPD